MSGGRVARSNVGGVVLFDSDELEGKMTQGNLNLAKNDDAYAFRSALAAELFVCMSRQQNHTPHPPPSNFVRSTSCTVRAVHRASLDQTTPTCGLHHVGLLTR